MQDSPTPMTAFWPFSAYFWAWDAISWAIAAFWNVSLLFGGVGRTRGVIVPSLHTVCVLVVALAVLQLYVF